MAIQKQQRPQTRETEVLAQWLPSRGEGGTQSVGPLRVGELLNVIPSKWVKHGSLPENHEIRIPAEDLAALAETEKLHGQSLPNPIVVSRAFRATGGSR